MAVLAVQSFWGYVIGAYVVVFGVIGLYAARTISRGRKLAARLPADQRRWIGSGSKR